MIEVPLSRGMVAIVDDDDFERVSRLRWYAHWSGRRWYARHERRESGTRVRLYMHRLLASGAEVDHWDGDGLNNRRANLRPATRSQNLANISQRADSQQPYKGIFMRPSGRWGVRVQGKTVGTFDSPDLAARAYDSAARRVFGAFARLNFPEER